MLPARKEEVFSMDTDSKNVEERLGAIEVSVAVLKEQSARTMADVGELRRETKDLRTRLEDGFQSVSKEISKVHQEISKAKIWALLIAAAILGVLARGFHWM
jgi:regulator of replication initiation timing